MKKRVLACTLAVLTLFCACKKDKDEAEKENEDATKITVDGEFEGGLHEVDYTQTSDYLVRNNGSDYKLLLPQNPSSELLLTTEDFVGLFKEATGVKLTVVQDNGELQHSDSVRYISLGETSLAESANVKTKDEELEDFGYSIQTVDKSIFINGNSDISVTFGAYGFLELQFNFDCFSNTYYYIDTVTESPLYDYDVREAPDLQVREEYVPMLDNKYARRRMKYVSRDEMFAGEGSVHTTMKYINPDVYNNPDDPQNYHPEWFGAGGSQLCHTAGGDEQSRDLLLNTVLKIMQEYFIAEPNDKIFSFGNMDISSWCSCTACTASYQKYKSNAAVVIQFVNELAARMDSWMASEAGRPYARDFQIVFLAYQKTIEAPAYYDDATDTYKPVDDSVICGPHTSVMFAPMEMDNQHSLNSPCNKSYKTAYEGWRVLSSRFNFYNYPMNYTTYLPYYDAMELMPGLYRYLAECNTYYFYECGPDLTSLSSFKSLLAYVSSKLSWNVNLDVNELIEKYCRYHFQDGGDIMLQVYKEVRGLVRSNIDLTCRRNSIYMNLEDANLWPKSLLKKWLDMTSEALDNISYLKKLDPEKYEVVSASIRRERLSFGYLLVTLYERELDSEYVYQLKLQTQEDAQISGITEAGFGVALASTWQKWGID